MFRAFQAALRHVLNVGLIFGLALLIIPGGAGLAPRLAYAWAHGVPLSGVVYVFDYMSAAQKTAAVNWSGMDDSTALTNAVAALNAQPQGGVLLFPDGRFQDASCAHTISVPALIVGAGMAKYDGTAAGTYVECSAGAATMFDMTGPYGKFEDISIADTAGSRTAGSAILVNGAYQYTKVDYESVYILGFYDAIDIATGESWAMHNVRAIGAVNRSVRIRNTVTPDAGDWSIAQCNFYPNTGSVAAIEIDSSGGGKITGNKISNNNGTSTNNILIAVSGSTQTLITGNSFEAASGPNLNVTAGWQGIIVTGNYFKTATGQSSIALTATPQAVITGNDFINTTTATYAVNFVSSVTFTTVASNVYYGFSYPAGGGSNNIVSYEGFSFSVAGNPVPSASQVPAGTKLFVTDANSTTGHAAYVGSSTNAVQVVSDGAAWHVGY